MINFLQVIFQCEECGNPVRKSIDGSNKNPDDPRIEHLCWAGTSDKHIEVDYEQS